MKISKLQKLFIGWIALMLLFLWYTTPEVYPLKNDDVTFRMTEQDELFFKNLRLADYKMALDSASQYKLYSLKAWPKPSYFPEMKIVQNWLNDEAYLFFELEEGMEFVVIQNDTSYLHQLNAEEQYILAQKLYQTIANNDEIELHTTLTAYTMNKDEKKSTKRLLKDYFRLVGKLR